MTRGHRLVRMHAVTGVWISFLARAQCTLHRLSIIRTRSSQPLSSFRSLPSERRHLTVGLASALVRRLQGVRLLNLVRTTPETAKQRIRGTLPVAHSNRRMHHVLGAPVPPPPVDYKVNGTYRIPTAVCSTSAGDHLSTSSPRSANVFDCGLGIAKVTMLG